MTFLGFLVDREEGSVVKNGTNDKNWEETRFTLLLLRLLTILGSRNSLKQEIFQESLLSISRNSQLFPPLPARYFPDHRNFKRTFHFNAWFSLSEYQIITRGSFLKIKQITDKFQVFIKTIISTISLIAHSWLQRIVFSV